METISTSRKDQVIKEMCARIRKVRMYHKHVHELNDDRGNAIVLGCDFTVAEYEKCIREMADHIRVENEAIGKLVVELSIIHESDFLFDFGETHNERPSY